MNQYRKLGDLLVEQGLITNLQLSVALSAQQSTNRRLGEVLVERGYASEDQISACLADQYGYPHWQPEVQHPEPAALEQLTPNIALSYCVLPLRITEDAFECALADPIDVITTDLLSQLVRKRLVLYIAPQGRLTKAIRSAYRLEEGPVMEPLGEAAFVPDRFINPKPRRRLGIATMMDAYDRELDRKVTLLCVSSGSVEEWEQYQLVRATARSQNKNICTVYDWMEANDHRWTVLEPLEGETLDQVLRNRGPRTFAQAAEIVAQIADGVEALNQSGGRCGLICPTNIAIRWNGPMLAPIANPPSNYGCPEVFAESNSPASSDVFALGTLLWECATGENPHATGETGVWWGDATKPAPNMPEPFRKVVGGCLDHDPTKRFASAFHLANTLRSYNWAALAHADEAKRFDKPVDRDHLLELLEGDQERPGFWQRLLRRKRVA